MINVPCSTLRWHLKRGNLRKYRSVIKPYLTDANKQKRIAYCLDNQGAVDPRTGKRQYNDYMDVIFLDEKWFCITKVSDCYILTPTKAPPERTIQHKSHITKVIFL
jgi:hypothetical protein